MHQINIKTPKKLPESSKLSESSEPSKIHLKSSRTPRNQILNEMNNSNSKYFKLPQTCTPTSANITHAARIFSENSIQILIAHEFDQSIEKIDFAADKSIKFSSNIAVKNTKQRTQKRKAD